jgi:hypothetical protein
MNKKYYYLYTEKLLNIWVHDHILRVLPLNHLRAGDQRWYAYCTSELGIGGEPSPSWGSEVSTGQHLRAGDRRYLRAGARRCQPKNTSELGIGGTSELGLGGGPTSDVGPGTRNLASLLNSSTGDVFNTSGTQLSQTELSPGM